MNVFISGGAKNGKSYFAQKTAKEIAEENNLPLYYVATMIPRDGEDRARIERHLRERDGWGFETLECAMNLSSMLRENDASIPTTNNQPSRDGVFLVDSVTAILANAMFPADIKTLDDQNDKQPQFGYNPDASKEVAEDLLQFLKEAAHVVFVSDYIYADPPATPVSRLENDSPDFSEEYRKGLAFIDRRLAEACDSVIEISAGIKTVHK